MRIVIAEDDGASRLVLRKSVERLGHDVIQADNAAQAFELFRECGPDAVISDWLARGMDGLDLCRRIREQDERYTYFLLLTDATHHSAALDGVKAGADDFLLRPFEPADLEQKLLIATRVMGLHRKHGEQRAELDRLNGELFEEGRRDPLTKIGNRVRLQEDLVALAARGRRYNHGFCVGLIDIDAFKSYNEACGHSAGDETLRIVARTIANHGRAGDAAYRCGGEEFMVVLPETPIEAAMVALERRRKAVEALAIPHPGRGGRSSLTISASVAAFDPRTDEPIEALLRRCGLALARSKQEGRNRVIRAEPGPEV